MAPANNTRSAKFRCRFCDEGFASCHETLYHEVNFCIAGSGAPIPWDCEYCKERGFSTHDETLEHMLICEKRTAELVTVTIPHEEGKIPGLTIADRQQIGEGGNERVVYSFSSNSPVFKFVRDVHTAANALFTPGKEEGYKYWPVFIENLTGDAIFPVLLDFGKRNLHTIAVDDG
ncbi:hypothetical protein ACHAXT_006054 [Thalassiosira profunda]